jgi:hypothetical protein
MVSVGGFLDQYGDFTVSKNLIFEPDAKTKKNQLIAKTFVRTDR